MPLEEVATASVSHAVSFHPWQPIETAPRDGTFVHLKFGCTESIGFWLNGEWLNGMGEKFRYDEPSSWMPLL